MRLRYWIEADVKTADELRALVTTRLHRCEIYESTPDNAPDTCTECGAECPEIAHPVSGPWHRGGCSMLATAGCTCGRAYDHQTEPTCSYCLDGVQSAFQRDQAVPWHHEDRPKGLS